MELSVNFKSISTFFLVNHDLRVAGWPICVAPR